MAALPTIGDPGSIIMAWLGRMSLFKSDCLIQASTLPYNIHQCVTCQSVCRGPDILKSLLLISYGLAKNSHHSNNNTHKAAIATLPLTTHPQWVEPHTFTSLEQIHAPITSLEWLNLPRLPFLPFHNLTKIPPKGVRLGARTCIFMHFHCIITIGRAFP